MNKIKVYPYSADIARENGELELYKESNILNIACANAIDKAISDNNYKTNYYAYDKAAETVIDEYGFERVNWVLANTIQQSHNDGRYSSNNRAWARIFDIPEHSIGRFVARTHPYVLDGFIDRVRKNHVEMLTEAIGKYEKSHRIAERNRLTWFNNDFGVFVANSGITEERLAERYIEIMEKKTKIKKIKGVTDNE